MALQNALADIAAAGATLVVISPQIHSLARGDEMVEELKPHALGDDGNRVAWQFGIVHTLPADLCELYLRFAIDLPRANGDASWTLPLPACFVIDRAGTIRSAYVEADYTRRLQPDFAHTIGVLRSLA